METAWLCGLRACYNTVFIRGCSVFGFLVVLWVCWSGWLDANGLVTCFEFGECCVLIVWLGLVLYFGLFV